MTTALHPSTEIPQKPKFTEIMGQSTEIYVGISCFVVWLRLCQAGAPCQTFDEICTGSLKQNLQAVNQCLGGVNFHLIHHLSSSLPHTHTHTHTFPWTSALNFLTSLLHPSRSSRYCGAQVKGHCSSSFIPFKLSVSSPFERLLC